MSPSTPVPEVLWQPTAGAGRARRGHPLRRVPGATRRVGSSLTTPTCGRTRSPISPASGGPSPTTSASAGTTSPRRCWASSPCPATEWFPGATLNYAEHALAAGRRPARRRHRGDRRGRVRGGRLVTLAELRAHGRGRAGRVCAGSAWVRATGWSRSSRTRLQALVGVPGHGRARRGLVVVLAGLRRPLGDRPVHPDRADGAVRGRRIHLRRQGLRHRGHGRGRSGPRCPGSPASCTSPRSDSAAARRGDRAGTSSYRRTAEPEYAPVPFAAPAVGAVLLGHHRTAQADRAVGRRNRAGAPEDACGCTTISGPGDRFFWFTTTGWMMWNLLIGGSAGGLHGGAVRRQSRATRICSRCGGWPSGIASPISGLSAPFVASSRSAGVEPSADAGSLVDRDGRVDRIAAVPGGLPLDRTSTSGSGSRSPRCPAAPTCAPRSWGRYRRCRCGWARSPAVHSARGSRPSISSGKSLIDEVGELVITAPMPSMPVFFWGDDDGSRLRRCLFRGLPRGVAARRLDPDHRPGLVRDRGPVGRHAEPWRGADGHRRVLPGGREPARRGRFAGGGHLDRRTATAILSCSWCWTPGIDLAVATAHLRAAIRTDLSPRHVPDWWYRCRRSRAR